MSFTEEEKIKILYEQSLGEIRSVVGRIEQVAASIATTARSLKDQETDAHMRSAKSLTQASAEIRVVVQKLCGVQDGMQQAAASSAREVLLGSDGPVAKLNTLVGEQRAALGWMNRAADLYSRTLTPWHWQTAFTALLCSAIGGALVKYL